MGPYLHIDRLTVGYNGKPLIHEIALSVRKGEIVTLIGPNGAGKSTILKSLSRQLAPLGGTVLLDGRPMAQMRGAELARKLALLTTERVDPERMTCRDVVGTGRYPYTGWLGILSREDRRIVEESLEQVHAGDLADCPFSNISDGQRQRILLARAICQNPDVILLDEPTSFLDIHHKLKLLDILKELVHKKHLAAVLSLHELELAQKISDTVACVSKSTVGPVGPPEDIFVPSVIEPLYSLPTGSYHALLGSVELTGVRGTPKVFVIGGGGSGTPVYRQLQRQGIPFATGILQQNDLDYPIAKSLAALLIGERAYQPVGPQTLRDAQEQMLRCEKVLCPLAEFGPYNAENQHLRQIAIQAGLLKNQ